MKTIRPRLNKERREKLAKLRGVSVSEIGARPRLSEEEYNLLNNIKEDATLTLLKEKYSDPELKIILNAQKPYVADKVSFEGKRFRIGIIGDTHIGSIYTEPQKIISAFDEFKRQGCDMIFHTGDVTEGMSNRPDHVYQCTHVGYNAQRDAAIDILSMTDIPMYVIDGNHDRWYIKNSGALIVKDICDNVKNCTFLGHDEGRINLGGVDVVLWHGEDTSSYATSYRVQKLVESFSGGEKPAALFCGHVHKQGYFFERNIHCLITATMQNQSKWMRSKRFPAHVGFHIVDMVISDNEIKSFTTTYYPFYK